MSAALRLTEDDETFLVKAYLQKPEGACNISSLAVFDENVVAHDAYGNGGYQRLVELGYIVGLEDRTWEVRNRRVEVVIFRLTPLGLSHAEALLNRRRSYSVRQRLSAISRSDWIAVLALIVSVVALFKTAK